MRSIIYPIVLLALLLGCSKQQDNPLLSKWDTPFETPPFDKIKTENYMPAMLEGMKVEMAEIEAIINNTEEPTFENTIVAFEKSGALLSKVSRVFGSVNGANTNDELQQISKELAPIRSKHSDDIRLNDKLFARIKAVYEQKDKLGLNEEELTLLENQSKGFVRSGANLNAEDKNKLRAINTELSNLYVNFRAHLLKENNSIALVIEDNKDLAGLPEDVVQSAAELAKSRDMDGKWAFTLQRPSFTPFLTYSDRRDLREKVLKAYVNRGNNDKDLDNKAIVAKIVQLRVKRANLLGYDNYAEFVLENNMAKTPENVYQFLNDLWTPAIKRANMEVKDMQALIKREGHSFKLKPWDWWYYSEKVKKEKYDLDEKMLRPYFKMENVRQGAFDVAQKLYGIQFKKRTDIQVYHPDVEVFEVLEEDGSHLGVFYSDYYPRDGKRSGAWSSSFRSQSNMDGNYITPLVFNVGNFAKPTADKPSLMSMDQVETLFHELGHGLNSLFGNTVYSGSRYTPRDFVELPSQVMENWARDPEVMKTYGKHYKTGEPIPDVLIEKIKNSGHFNQGFATVEYLAASFLDMDWHMLKDTTERNVPAFEKAALTKINLIPEIESRYQSTNFQHIFAGSGYTAGYYSYIWAAVLDADAFQAFKEKGLFNRELANSFRKNVLSRGSTDMMAQYVKFRGAEPKVEALLKRRGLD